MGKAPKQNSTRKPPEPSESHADIDDWMRRVMPDLNPIVEWLDAAIRETLPGVRFGVKWKRAYYELPERGWVIELVAYDVSVNVVFLGGAKFESPPPLGEGASRYVKVRSLDEAQAPEIREWIEEAGRVTGWQASS
jgi:hypothetical protein